LTAFYLLAAPCLLVVFSLIPCLYSRMLPVPSLLSTATSMLTPCHVHCCPIVSYPYSSCLLKLLPIICLPTCPLLPTCVLLNLRILCLPPGSCSLSASSRILPSICLPASYRILPSICLPAPYLPLPYLPPLESGQVSAYQLPTCLLLNLRTAFLHPTYLPASSRILPSICLPSCSLPGSS
jgi:hypothetical protein